MAETPPTLTPPPTPPQRSDSANFPARGDAFLGWFPSAWTQLSAALANAYANAVTSFDSATASQASAVAAGNAQAVAVTSAQIAASYTGALPWVSGQTYAAGAAALSLVTGFAYRRRVAGSGTVDPSADGVNWTLAAPAELLLINVDATTATASSGGSYALRNAAASTLTLPAGPLVGDFVGVLAANLRRDNTVVRNGQLIMGAAEDLTVNRLGAAIGLKFVGGGIGWQIVKIDSLANSFPFQIDSSGRILANVALRTGTLSSLLALAGSPGEISAAPSDGALVLHTGTAGQARQVGSGRVGRLLVRARVTASIANNAWTTPGGWTELYDPDGLFDSATGVLAIPSAAFARMSVAASITWVDSASSTGQRRVRLALGTVESGDVPMYLDARTPLGGGNYTVLDGQATFDAQSTLAGEAATSLKIQVFQDTGGALPLGLAMLEVWGEPL